MITLAASCCMALTPPFRAGLTTCVLLIRFTLKNCPDTRRSKPPIDSIGGRHTGDGFEICPQVERRSRSDNAVDGYFTKPSFLHIKINPDLKKSNCRKVS